MEDNTEAMQELSKLISGATEIINIMTEEEQLLCNL